MLVSRPARVNEGLSATLIMTTTNRLFCFVRCCALTVQGWWKTTKSVGDGEADVNQKLQKWKVTIARELYFALGEDQFPQLITSMSALHSTWLMYLQPCFFRNNLEFTIGVYLLVNKRTKTDPEKPWPLDKDLFRKAIVAKHSSATPTIANGWKEVISLKVADKDKPFNMQTAKSTEVIKKALTLFEQVIYAEILAKKAAHIEAGGARTKRAASQQKALTSKEKATQKAVVSATRNFDGTAMYSSDEEDNEVNQHTQAHSI
jgi:hypothetical protein